VIPSDAHAWNPCHSQDFQQALKVETLLDLKATLEAVAMTSQTCPWWISFVP
jgi:hypothetical protein